MARERTRKEGGRGRNGRGARRTPAGATAATARAALVRGAVLLLLWWALTEGAGGLLFAAVLVPAGVGVSLVLAPARGRRLSAVGLLRFVPFFLWSSLRGGIDVARRALDPRLRIAPAVQDFRLRVRDDRERVLVASVVSLLPGSVSAALEGDRLRLHVLDRGLPNERTLRDVEARVAGVFGNTLAPAGETKRPARAPRGRRR